MTIEEIFNNVHGNTLWPLLIISLMTLIEISPIKINPWKEIGRLFKFLIAYLGNLLNGEVIEKVDQLTTDLQALRNECDEREACLCRTHILRFGDELLHEVSHSQEHFQQIMIDIDKYETYCSEHPDFQNNIATATIHLIMETYNDCLHKNNFL